MELMDRTEATRAWGWGWGRALSEEAAYLRAENSWYPRSAAPRSGL